jgi:hypothetical protein
MKKQTRKTIVGQEDDLYVPEEQTALNIMPVSNCSTDQLLYSDYFRERRYTQHIHHSHKCQTDGIIQISISSTVLSS